jgi:hypothetical protein
MRRSRILGVVGITAIGFLSLVARNNPLEALSLTLVLSGIFLLLWQTILSLGTDVEPLDFFPGTVLILVGLASDRYGGEYQALIPIALAILVGLGVMMRSFGEPPQESEDEDPGKSG